MVRVKGRYALTDHWFEEFENEDDTECEQLDCIQQSDVTNLWSKIEQYRRAIAWQEARFNRWLEVATVKMSAKRRASLGHHDRVDAEMRPSP